MRFALMMIILSFSMVSSCQNAKPAINNTSNQSTDSKSTSKATDPNLISSEAIVLGKNEQKDVKQLLITQDLNNPKLKENLKTLAKQSPEDIIIADQYDLAWLDVKNIEKSDIGFNNLEIGSKIRFETLNGQFDTLPPTLVAQKVDAID